LKLVSKLYLQQGNKSIRKKKVGSTQFLLPKPTKYRISRPSPLSNKASSNNLQCKRKILCEEQVTLLLKSPKVVKLLLEEKGEGGVIFRSMLLRKPKAFSKRRQNFCIGQIVFTILTNNLKKL
jgi:hypothetical protein